MNLFRFLFGPSTKEVLARHAAAVQKTLELNEVVAITACEMRDSLGRNSAVMAERAKLTTKLKEAHDMEVAAKGSGAGLTSVKRDDFRTTQKAPCRTPPVGA